MKNFKLLIILTLIACAFLTGCYTESPDNGGSTPNVPTMQNATIKGIVSDVNGNPLQGVIVTTGTESALSATDGTFAFSKVAVVDSRAVIKFEKNGYFTLTRSGVKTGEMYILAAMQATGNTTVSSTTSFDAASAKTLSAGGMKVDIPVSAFVKADGTAYSGTVKADLFYLSPDNDNFDVLMPGGDLSAIRTNGSSAQLISYGMTNVVFTDNSGNPLKLKNGAKSKLTYPVPESKKTNPPATIPLWYFDENKGIWIEEGSSTLQGNTYVGEVSHFTWWNCDYPEEVVTIKGKVTDCENKSVAWVKVTVEQSDGTNSKGTTTNSIGEYSIYIPANTPITISVKSKSYNISGKAGNVTVTQNFSIPCTDFPTYSGTVNSSLPVGKLTFLTYNLGANPNMTIEQQAAYVPINVYDATVAGDLYQWGRCTDGHEKRTSETTYAVSSSDVPGHGNFIISSSATNHDWRYPQNNNLWGAKKTANDPCPSGFRVPTQAEWNSIMPPVNTWTSVFSKDGRNLYGTLFSPDGGKTNTLFLPATFYRGGYDNRDINGYGSADVVIHDNQNTGGALWSYWSSNASNGTSWAFQTGGGETGGGGLNVMRSQGSAVRCVKEY